MGKPQLAPFWGHTRCHTEVPSSDYSRERPDAYLTLPGAAWCVAASRAGTAASAASAGTPPALPLPQPLPAH